VLQVPLSPIPAQTLAIILGGQNCTIAVYQKGDALYFDLVTDSVTITTTRVCRNKIRLLLSANYLGFVGDFVFVDTQGDTQPQYAQLNTRYVLLYLEAADI